MTEFRYSNKEDFLKKITELFESGLTLKKMNLHLPNHDHEVEHLVEKYERPSRLKFFTLAGGLAGCITGFAFTSFTVLDWPLITGGKPLLSWPAFVVIAFELTILFGTLASFAGIMLLGRLPKFSKMLSAGETNDYVITIDDE